MRPIEYTKNKWHSFTMRMHLPHMHMAHIHPSAGHVSMPVHFSWAEKLFMDKRFQVFMAIGAFMALSIGLAVWAYYRLGAPVLIPTIPYPGIPF